MDSTALILLVLLAGAAACGPRPRIERARTRAAGGREFADVLVSNAGGEGEASVTVHLRDRKTGAEFVKEQGVSLRLHGSVWTAIAVDAPAGEYELSSEVQYPP